MQVAALVDDFDKSLNLTELRIIIPVGTEVSTDLFEKLVQIFPLLAVVPNVYGMTEFGCKFHYFYLTNREQIAWLTYDELTKLK